MAEHGLLDVTEAGSSRLYALNRDHVAAAAALALLDLRGQLYARIRDAIAGWHIRPVAAAVFGSAARGDGSVDSDIDLFVVRPKRVAGDDPLWVADVTELARHVRRWSGNAASIIQAAPDQAVAMMGRGESIIDALRSEAVPLTRGPVVR